MIFTAPRFVVVDDKIEHLEAIVQAFQQLGSPCIGIQYKPEEELDANIFRGVRVLFLDLHLIDSSVKTDDRPHYAVIAGILEDKIHVNGGPFVLVLWTEHAHCAQGLTEYLDMGLDKKKPHSRPLVVVPLSKDNLINKDDKVTDPEELRRKVREAVTANAQLAALLDWETDVMTAAGDTLVALLNLVPTENRTNTSYSDALDVILSRLACEAVGKPHVEVNQRAAITTALAPILIDRMMNQEISKETLDLWSKAITRHSGKKLEDASPEEAGHLNKMLHLAIPGSETVRPADWGAVVRWPYEWNDDELLCRMGFKIPDMLGGQFLIERKDRARCKPHLVRIGAACDYAQNKEGPITYLLAMEIPEDAERKKNRKTGDDLELSDAIWRSPVFITTDSAESFRLYVHIRFPISVLPSMTDGWFASYRMREQLLMNLLTFSSNYSSRPGIVQLPIK
ncbi:MAG TPA: hypothetical protein VIG33_04070 [Pseudobdellovibrionaceae bacterium]|jgi:hypothetical protein